MGSLQSIPTSKQVVLRARIAAFLEDAPQVRGVQSEAGFSIGSVKGPVRKDNQDRALAAYLVSPQSGNDRLFIAMVCDGMGGLERGGEAATIAASAFLAKLACAGTSNLPVQLEEAVLAANNAVYELLRGRGGSTLTALVYPESGTSWCAHVGDSRLYRRVKLQGEIDQITRDDTLEAIIHGRGQGHSDEKSGALLQYIGMGSDLQPHVTPTQSYREQLVVLTTDGAHAIDPSTFEDICSEARTADELTKRLLLIAEATGAKDNATAISVIPSRLIPAHGFVAGQSIQLWSPWQRLNIWLPDEFETANIAVPQSLEKLPVRNPKKAKTAGRKLKIKKKATTAPEHFGSRNSEDGKPEVQIEFEQDGDPNDKTS